MPFQLEKSIDQYSFDEALLQPFYSNSGDYAATGPVASAGSHTFPQTLRDAIFTRLRILMDTRRNVIGPKWGTNQDGGFYYTGYANPTSPIPPKPADIISEVKVDRVVSKNGNFKARKKAGEIVVAPYASEGFVRVKRVAGMKDISSSYLGYHWLMIGLVGSAGLLSQATAGIIHLG